VIEPKRYDFRIRACDCVKREHLEGKYAPLALIIEETKENCGWVSYEDYARLRSEVERLTDFTTRTIIPNEELQAQVERLTKAGDAMCRMAGNNQVINRHWKTAKKGVQS
jgi:hypothetical protein